MSAFPMRVEVTFSNGMRQIILAQAVVFVKECDHCLKEFRTENRAKKYCEEKCGEEHREHRRLLKP